MTRRIINSDADIDRLIQFLLPQHRFANVHGAAELHRMEHPTEVQIKTLWDQGRCTPKGINKMCSAIINAHGWNDVVPATPPSEEHRKRLLKEVQRLNAHLRASDCSYYAWIKYDRSTSTLQLRLDPTEVLDLASRAEDRSRLKGQTKEIGIQIVAEYHANDVPVLKVGDLIRCHLKVPIAGYPHLFHIDANNAVDRLFPAKGAKRETVRCGETLDFPKDLLKAGFWWRVGETPGKKSGVQRVVMLISRLDIKVTAEHLRRFGIEVGTRGAVQNEPDFEDVAPGAIAFGSARYEWRVSSSKSGEA